VSDVDDGRTAVYAAEDAAFGGTDAEDERSIGDLVAAAAALTGGEWWHAAGGPPVRVAAARAGTASSSARTAGQRAAVDVRLADAQRTLATLAHELGHALAGVDHGHDARFRAAHVDVCALLVGRDGARRLADAYGDLGVAPGRRPWPSPVRVTGEGFAVLP
jgi:hypothetical protein